MKNVQQKETKAQNVNDKTISQKQPTMQSGPEAIRAYLQRAEVRLSTMHRIGGAFISGAGLLILLPLFLRDGLTSAIQVWVTPPEYLQSGFFIIAAIPIFITFVLPLIATYLLLRELILFYFSANIPEPKSNQLSESVFHPRFALTAIPFSNDEADDHKAHLRELQFNDDRLINFVLPKNRDEKVWLSQLLEDDKTLKIALPELSKYLPSLDTIDKVTIEDRNRLRMAFGLAGAYDRDLREEAAKTELSLIRHNLLLRRLMMRYIKALIMFIWTALIFFTIAAYPSTLPNKLIIVQCSLLLWSSFVPFWIRAPVRWIYTEFDQDAPDRTHDPHLVNFEKLVAWFCLLASAFGTYFIVYGLKTSSGYVGILGIIFNFVVLLRAYGYLNKRIFRWI